MHMNSVHKFVVESWICCEALDRAFIKSNHQSIEALSVLKNFYGSDLTINVS